MKKLSSEILAQGCRFTLVGIGSNIISFSLYMTCVGGGLGVFFSSVSGYVVGLSCSFLLGKIWVFDAEDLANMGAAIRFGVVYLIGGLGMSAITFFCYDLAMLDYRLCWAVGAIFAVINNFLGSKYYAFRRKG